MTLQDTVHGRAARARAHRIRRSELPQHRAGSASAFSRSTSSLVGCRRSSGGWPTAQRRSSCRSGPVPSHARLTRRHRVSTLSLARDSRLKFTAIWQSKKPHELPWIEEIFGDLIAEHVFDGNHEVVLDDAILFDSFIKRVPHDYYRKFEGKNAFLVHFLDETYEGGYERYDHFRGVIRNFWSSGVQSKEGVHPSGGLLEAPPSRSSRRSRPPHDENTSGPSTANCARAAGLMPSRRCGTSNRTFCATRDRPTRSQR